MYIKQVIRNKDNWAYYLIGILIIIPVTWVIFQIPYVVAVTAASFQDAELLAKIQSGDMVATMSVLEPNLIIP